MAGLSHDPHAANCVKNETGAGVEGAVCRLCEKNGRPADAGHESVGAIEPPSGPALVAQFLERVGLAKDAAVYDVRTADGELLAGYWSVKDVAYLGTDGALEIVITFAEDGVRGAMPRRVRWSQIVSFHA
jgi:hypothetical protein